MKIYWAIICCLLILIACKSKELQPISRQEAIAFARAIESSIKNKNEAVLDNAIDIDLIAEDAIKKAGIKNKASAKKGIKKGFKQKGVAGQIIATLNQGSSYEFVREYEKEGNPHLIFRLYGDDGLNYHDLDLIKYNNKIRIKDMFIYATGENVSATVAHVYNSEMAYHNKAILKLKTLSEQKKYEAAKKLFNSLPESLRKERLMQVIYLPIAYKIDSVTFRKAIDDFYSLYGNDPSAQLALLSVYFSKENYEKALSTIDNLDENVQDPLLDYFRAIIYNKQGNPAKSTEKLERLFKNKPNFENGALELISNYINDKQFKKADTLIAIYKTNKGFNQDNLYNIKLLYPESTNKVTW